MTDQKMLVDVLETLKNKVTGSNTHSQGPWLQILQTIAENFDAAEGSPGIVQLASSTEAGAGTNTTKAVTPAGLAAALLTAEGILPATTSLAGAVELATSAETITGTDDERAVTPADLASLTSTSSRKGLVELATAAEALAGTDTARAVTPAGLEGAIENVELISFVGKNLTGACTATGLKVGDLVLSVTGLAAATVGDQSSLFESTITVNDQIQQSSNTDLHLNVYMALIYRKS